MKYCSDTWFLLKAFAKDPKAISMIEETKHGKTTLIIPIISFSEATKKLMQNGVSGELIDKFFESVEASDKVELAVIDKSIAYEAARISISFGMPLIDSLVAATSKLTGCDILLTADSDYKLLSKRQYIKIQSW